MKEPGTFFRLSWIWSEIVIRQFSKHEILHIYDWVSFVLCFISLKESWVNWPGNFSEKRIVSGRLFKRWKCLRKIWKMSRDAGCMKESLRHIKAQGHTCIPPVPLLFTWLLQQIMLMNLDCVFLFSDIIKIKIWNECVQIIGNKYCIYMYKIFDDSNTKENVSKQAA